MLKKDIEKEITKLTKRVKYLEGENERLEQDCEDMWNSLCTIFTRCKCGRVIDKSYKCQYCDYDGE